MSRLKQDQERCLREGRAGDLESGMDGAQRKPDGALTSIGTCPWRGSVSWTMTRGLPSLTARSYSRKQLALWK